MLSVTLDDARFQVSPHRRRAKVSGACMYRKASENGLRPWSPWMAAAPAILAAA